MGSVGAWGACARGGDGVSAGEMREKCVRNGPKTWEVAAPPPLSEPRLESIECNAVTCTAWGTRHSTDCTDCIDVIDCIDNMDFIDWAGLFAQAQSNVQHARYEQRKRKRARKRERKRARKRERESKRDRETERD